jgi:hypothetical protein
VSRDSGHIKRYYVLKCPWPSLLGESREKAGYHRNNALWERNTLRDPIVSTRVARDGRLGGSGHGGCSGRTARDAGQCRGCRAQNYTARRAALRCWRYLLLSRVLKVALAES